MAYARKKPAKGMGEKDSIPPETYNPNGFSDAFDQLMFERCAGRQELILVSLVPQTDGRTHPLFLILKDHVAMVSLVSPVLQSDSSRDSASESK